MKKQGILFACLIIGNLHMEAQQRLAVFAAGNEPDTLLLCISVDFFCGIGSDQLYGAIGKEFTPKYISAGPGRFDGKARKELSPVTGVGYFGIDNTPVSAWYKKFLDQVIAAYKDRSRNYTWYDLQEKVWTYNVMDKLGFIDRNVSDQLSAFTKARAQFLFLYGLNNRWPKADSTHQEAQGFLNKASQIYFNRKYAARETQMPDSISFADSMLHYRQDRDNYQLPISYQDMRVVSLSPYSAALKDAIYMYTRDYQIWPEMAMVSELPEQPDGYLLTLSTKNSNPRYIMQVVLVNSAANLINIATTPNP